MSTQQRIIKNKLELLKRGQTLGGVSKAVSGWRRLVLALLRAVIVIGLIVIFLEFGFRLYPPIVPAALGLVGRVVVCPLSDAVLGAHRRYRLFEAIEDVKERLRLIQSDADGYRLWETPMGNFWTPDDSAVAVLVAQQLVDDYGTGNRGVQPGDVVLDCGAHVGFYVRKALDSGARLVVAIEPAPNNVECLRRNFADEITSGKVVVYPRGVWDETKLLPLFEDPLNSAADSFLQLLGRAVVHHHIEVTTIDEIAAELELSEVDVIKMDIKGAVERALRGAVDTLAKNKPLVVIATEEMQDDPHRITEFMAGLSLGYRVGCGTCYVHNWFLYPQVLFLQ